MRGVHAVRAITGPVPALVTILAVACSAPSPATPRLDLTSDDENPAALARDLAAPGPHPVGFTRARLDAGHEVVVWYPSTPRGVAGRPLETIDLVGFLSPDLQAKIPDGDRVTYTAAAHEDAEPSEGAHPVVVFSHGLAGFAEQSVTLTTHLASHGYVVAAPDHVDRSLGGMLGDAAAAVTDDVDDVELLGVTLDWIVARSAAADGLLAGTVDPDRATVAGHSRGASAAYLAAATDARFGAFIAYSIDLSDHVADSESHAVPAVPGMVMTGTRDGVNDPAASRRAFNTLGDPRYLVEIEGAGHLVFTDLCLIGRERGGVVALARRLDLGVPDELLALGTDGCSDEFPPTTEAFGAIDAASVAFLDGVLGVGDAAVAHSVLATRPLSTLGTPVSVTSD